MELIIVDEKEFEDAINMCNITSVKNEAKMALGRSKKSGIEPLKQLIMQEKEKNEKLLKEKEKLIKQNNEYQKYIDSIS